MAKTAFVACQHCGKEFRSPIQVPENSGAVITGNQGKCPHCGKMTSTDKLTWKEEK